MSTTFAECRSCLSLNKLNTVEALKKSPVCGKCGSALPVHGLVSEVTSAGFEKVLKNAETPVIEEFRARSSLSLEKKLHASPAQ